MINIPLMVWLQQEEEREKATARALILYERKIKYLKERAVEELLSVCTEIAKTKEQFGERASKISSDFIKNDMLEYKDSYAFFENRIYDVCNLLEKTVKVLPIKDGMVKLTFKPFEIHTLRVE